jgi:hypothetical protein
VTLAEDAGDNFTGLDRMEDGRILYEIEESDMLAIIADDGSQPPDTVADPGSNRWAHAIPGAEAALLLDCPGCDLGIVSYETAEIQYVLENVARAWHVPTGHIVYVRSDGAVFAAAFDPETLTMADIGTPLFEGVRVGNGFADMVVGDDGTMVYVTGSSVASGNTEYLTWVDREGNYAEVDPSWEHMNLSAPALSPDGRRVALALESTDGSTEIWVKELPDGPLTRITHLEASSFNPFWSPDGGSIVFTHLTQDAPATIRRIRSDGSTRETEILLEADSDPVFFPNLTPDGTGFVFNTPNPADLGYHDIEADTTRMLLTADYGEFAGTISPDGRWLAYVSFSTGEAEVFVRPFPDVERSRVQISRNGGWEPRWAHNGRELFFRSEDRDLVVATYAADSTFTVESRTVLFRVGFDYINRGGSVSYAVDATDERFLMVRNSEAQDDGDAEVGDMILVQNWFTELEERLGSGN